MELRIKLQGKNATLSGSPKEIRKVLDSMNREYNELKQSLVNTVKLPEVKEIVDFIESKPPEFIHSMPEILTKFIGNDANIRNNRKIYDLMFRKCKEARSIIEGKHHGAFIGKKESPTDGEKRSLRKITVYRLQENPTETST